MTLAGPLADRLPVAAEGAASWRDRLASLRNGLYASPAFQRWAARLPVVRWVARSRSRALFDVVAGFAYTQTLAACVRLDIFALLRDAPQTSAALAGRLSIPAEGLERLLRAAAALELVEARDGGRWGLGAMGAPLLASPGLARLVEHNALLYEELRDPLALLRRPAGDRGTALAEYWPYAAAGRRSRVGAADVAGYTALMAATVTPIAEEILDAVPLDGARALLDVGGGDGGFVAAVAERRPGLRLALLDLPPVAARAARRLRDAGLADRVSVHGADFHAAALPGGADVVTLVRVLLDHDDDAVLALLRRVRDALAPGGRVVVAEPFAGVRGAEVVGDVYFGFYLWAMGRGRARRESELRGLLRAAGFRRVRTRRTRYPVQCGVMEGIA
ncbi:methyltransferase [Roseisolibacter sp. H3M3-2]|uniref:methyltransferase n=1 Tax=Roseisolibacter sp. H3M3-2 TaxID=3031323 RepID=UPI0023DB94C8|nr:methyltransferase [Roseisolibacter sp. H3M3-2]MDF1503553.1 methyltransferase [Roseisolibacter sp. H3M3-2]